jgi:DNA-binding MarR family transcriptional regulator
MLAGKHMSYRGATHDETSDRLRVVIARLARRLRSTASAGSLTPTQVSVLFTVVRRGPLALSELAEIESLNPTMLSRVVGALADAGLLVRSADAADRRAAQVSASAAGRRLRARIHAERNAALGAALAQLAPEQRDAIAAALDGFEELAELLR